MDNAEKRIGQIPKAEEIKTPEKLAAPENPEVLKEKILSISRIEVDDFKAAGETGLTAAHVRAEKEGLTVDKKDEEELAGVNQEAGEARVGLLRSIGEIVKSISRKLFSSKDQGQSANEQLKIKKDPFFEDMLNGPNEDYDGNKALAREQWLKENHIKVIRSLAALHNENPKKYSSERLHETLRQVKAYSKMHDFDIGLIDQVKMPYVTNRLKMNFFPVQIRHEIIRQIAGGQLLPFNEKYLRKKLGNAEFERVCKATLKKNQLTEIEENKKRRNIETFRKEGRDKEPLIMRDGPVAVIETHAEKGWEDSIQRVGDILPLDLPATKLRVDYQEQAKSDIGGLKREGDIFTTVDASGFLPQEFLQNMIKQQEKSSFILTGGNLRGCQSSSFKSIIDYVKKVKSQQTDIHVLLDESYDNNSYDKDKFSKFPSTRISRLNSQYRGYRYETYVDQKVEDVSDNFNIADLPRIRLFLWSKKELLAEAI
jgi:hypothetical protein